MPLNHFSVLMAPTYRCNADCEYCFENKTSDVMELEDFERILPRIVTYLRQQEVTELKFVWTGGEILTMSPEWLLTANDVCRETAELRPDSSYLDPFLRHHAFLTARRSPRMPVGRKIRTSTSIVKAMASFSW